MERDLVSTEFEGGGDGDPGVGLRCCANAIDDVVVSAFRVTGSCAEVDGRIRGEDNSSRGGVPVAGVERSE